MDWCNSCGTRAPGDATFCPACGVRLPVDGAQRTVEAALTGTDGAVGGTDGAAIPRGWYPDPAAAAPLRWWTGESWSPVVNAHPEGAPRSDPRWAHPLEAAWLPDPSSRAPWRWWDGARFTGHLSEGTAVWLEADGGGS